jgi:hypothetical protein
VINICVGFTYRDEHCIREPRCSACGGISSRGFLIQYGLGEKELNSKGANKNSAQSSKAPPGGAGGEQQANGVGQQDESGVQEVLNGNGQSVAPNETLVWVLWRILKGDSEDVSRSSSVFPLLPFPSVPLSHFLPRRLYLSYLFLYILHLSVLILFQVILPHRPRPLAPPSLRATIDRLSSMLQNSYWLESTFMSVCLKLPPVASRTVEKCYVPMAI